MWQHGTAAAVPMVQVCSRSELVDRLAGVGWPAAKQFALYTYHGGLWEFAHSHLPWMLHKLVTNISWFNGPRLESIVLQSGFLTRLFLLAVRGSAWAGNNGNPMAQVSRVAEKVMTSIPSEKCRKGIAWAHDETSQSTPRPSYPMTDRSAPKLGWTGLARWIVMNNVLIPDCGRLALATSMLLSFNEAAVGSDAKNIQPESCCTEPNSPTHVKCQGFPMLTSLRKRPKPFKSLGPQPAPASVRKEPHK